MRYVLFLFSLLVTEVSLQNITVLTNHTFVYASNESLAVYCIYNCTNCITHTVLLYANDSLLCEFKGPKVNVKAEAHLPDNNIGMIHYNDDNDTHEFGIKFFNASRALYTSYVCKFEILTTIDAVNVTVDNYTVDIQVYAIDCLTFVKYFAGYLYVDGELRHILYNTNVYKYKLNTQYQGLGSYGHVYLKNTTTSKLSVMYYSLFTNFTCILKERHILTSIAWINVTQPELEFKPIKPTNETVMFNCSTPRDNAFPMAWVAVNNTIFAGYNGTDTFLYGNKNDTIALTKYTNMSFLLSLTLYNYSEHDIYDCYFPFSFNGYTVV